MAAGVGTRDYQRAQVALRAVVYADTALLWRLLDMDRLDATFPVFANAAIKLIETRRLTSSQIAARYLAVRRFGVPGSLPPVNAPALDRAAALVSLGVVSVSSIKSAMTRNVPIERASRNALVRTMGVVDKYVGDGGRELIRASVAADPAARGWIRVTLGTCKFCAKQAAGDHMHSGEAHFPRHDHCGCQPEPQYEAPTASPSPTSRFTPDQLRNALDPSRKRTVSAIKKELEATPAGRDLTSSLKGFTETRGGVANLRKNIEKTLDGSASPAVRERSHAFLDAMNSYPAEDVPTLYRGFAVKVEDTNEWWDTFEGQFQPGQKFSLNASSFSSSEKKAAEFSRMIGGTKKASSNHTAVRMVLEGDTHALPVEQLSKFKNEKEWITAGDFEVVGYEPATVKHPYYQVKVRQIKKLEAAS